MDRLQVLWKIDELNSEYETASSKRQKQIDKELVELGNILKQNPRRDKKIQQLLAKGRDMNAQDIKQLSDWGITHKQIKQVLKIDNVSFYEYLKNHGLVKERKEVMPKSAIAEAKELLANTDLSIPEIAKKTGAKEPTVYYHAKKIRGGTQKDITPPKKEHKKQIVQLKESVKSKEISPEHMKLKQEHEELKKIYHELRILYQKITEQESGEIADLKMELEQAEREAELLKQDAEHYSNLYEQEVAAHEHLFNYIQILRKRGNE